MTTTMEVALPPKIAMVGPYEQLIQLTADEKFALVMNAAASIEDAGNCLQDADARKMAEGAAEYFREAARNKYQESA